jgi:hypothetical protein
VVGAASRQIVKDPCTLGALAARSLPEVVDCMAAIGCWLKPLGGPNKKARYLVDTGPLEFRDLRAVRYALPPGVRQSSYVVHRLAVGKWQRWPRLPLTA